MVLISLMWLIMFSLDLVDRGHVTGLPLMLSRFLAWMEMLETFLEALVVLLKQIQLVAAHCEWSTFVSKLTTRLHLISLVRIV